MKSPIPSKTRTPEPGPLLTATLSSLPPPTLQQHFYRRWTTSVRVSLSSRRGEATARESRWLCAEWTSDHQHLFSFLILCIQSAGLQRGPGSGGTVLQTGTLLDGGTARGALHAGSPEPHVHHRLLCGTGIFISTCLACPLLLLSRRVKRTRSGRALPLREPLWDFLPAGTVPGSDKWKSSLVFSGLDY